jgi:hypothetical protein
VHQRVHVIISIQNLSTVARKNPTKRAKMGRFGAEDRGFLLLMSWKRNFQLETALHQLHRVVSRPPCPQLGRHSFVEHFSFNSVP